MTERDLPVNMTPEYWAGHNLNDSCEKEEAKRMSKDSEEEYKRGNELGIQILRRFLRSGNKTPISSIDKGRLLDARDFPVGTILRLNCERLTLSENGLPPYINTDNWAVISSLDESGQEKSIFRYIMRSDGSFHYLGINEGPSIKVGEIDHIRLFLGELFLESLFRVNDAKVYEIGMEPTESKRRKAVFPRFCTAVFIKV